MSEQGDEGLAKGSEETQEKKVTFGEDKTAEDEQGKENTHEEDEPITKSNELALDGTCEQETDKQCDSHSNMTDSSKNTANNSNSNISPHEYIKDKGTENDEKDKCNSDLENYNMHSKHSTDTDLANETTSVTQHDKLSSIDTEVKEATSDDKSVSEQQHKAKYSLNSRDRKRNETEFQYTADKNAVNENKIKIEHEYLTDDEKFAHNSFIQSSTGSENKQTNRETIETENAITRTNNSSDIGTEHHYSSISENEDNENIPLPISEPMSQTADIKETDEDTSEKVVLVEAQNINPLNSSSRRSSVTSVGSREKPQPKLQRPEQSEPTVTGTSRNDISHQILTRKTDAKKPDSVTKQGGQKPKQKQINPKRATLVPAVRKSTTPTPRSAVTKESRRTQSRAKSAYPGRTSDQEKRSSPVTSSRASSRKSRPRSCGYESEARRRETEFFRAELQRLKNSLKRESSKIRKPAVRDHYPDVFTSLEPYYNTYTASYLIKMPEYGYEKATTDADAQIDIEPKDKTKDSEEKKDLKYTTRCTAMGMTDPWDSLKMDKSVLPKIETAEMRKKRMDQIHNQMQQASKPRVNSATQERQSPSSKKRPEAKMGSTRLPKFPVINLTKQELFTKELIYSDVPMLRDEAAKTFGMNGPVRKQKDFDRTRQDFYRMELDRISDLHPFSKPHMRKAYFAYLQNTPGSRKAIYRCMKDMQSEGEVPSPHATPPPEATPPPQAVA